MAKVVKIALNSMMAFIFLGLLTLPVLSIGLIGEIKSPEINTNSEVLSIHSVRETSESTGQEVYDSQYSKTPQNYR